MNLSVGIMQLEEAGIITDYFNGSSPEHLELMGVDPTRIPNVQAQKKFIEQEYAKEIRDRRFIAVVWKMDGAPIGFSTVEKIVFGSQAYMHLHIVDEGLRRRGIGVRCVKESVKIYFDILELGQLYCEPNAFNVAPNRALQNAGFRYVKTHRTVPGPLNYHQAVNRWVMENNA